MTAADGWLRALSQGLVMCRIEQDGACEFTPTAPDQLWTRIRIHETGNMAHGDFAMAYRDFVESGATAGRYEGEACETIVKFGSAIQFRQAFAVEFRRRDGVGLSPA